MRSILFRADGNTQIGMGHLMRSLALATMLGDSFKRRFAIYQPTPSVKALLSEHGFPVISLGTQHIDELIQHSQAEDIVVLDGYHFDEAFQKVLRSKIHKLVFIDDLIFGHQVADVILNHTAGIPATEYEAEPYTQFLLGPRYALVNPLFRAAQLHTSAKDILINLGGADIQNISHDLTNWLLRHYPECSLRVVLGSANPHVATFSHFPQDQVTLLQSLSVIQMAHEIAHCRLAIVSCSTIAYEVASIGRPFIGILTADNQKRLAHFFVQEGLALGVLKLPLNPSMLPSLLNLNGFSDSIKRQRHYLDGLSGQRLREFFQTL
ncbi:UDP-2,4-diacetamido-2,4,6-trideoxy-beta-L-altropyranose hydrolase [Rudanella paleaurantiibacter]|uniref:UDP-2,4-diacetamido-2,4, 6-trideoxy-beta-L-altropyranose hydrolase n=1 Tax=Rudanella paleaurantiibacter TaxID=2614655 RepID=A0A7J5U330_9BACT|nr:UDP-2,4-diacetamido-2,4,6-trideoxy-beta-L-altropyranose hydrolase [Rudanella paleaurantiibacter]KAB7732209.1 UDP-2,4-diacetamido-2,4,6-trideoxy-beta-L-altropyranose hydrolase [Rudanella paleaurantiibacter]